MKQSIALVLLLGLLLSMAAPALAAPLGDTTYVVRAGDTLTAIAGRHGVTVAAIVAANGIANPNLIFIGQTLVIPGASGAPPAPAPAPAPGGTPVPPTGGTCVGGNYTVRSGDTLLAIAARNGTTVAAIAALNGIVNINLIFVGQVLKLPGGNCPPGGNTPPPAPPAPTPAPVPPPTSSGSFELGGQVAGFSYPDLMKHAGMVWVKRQVHWNPNEPAGNHFGLMTDAHARGFKILLTVLGSPGDISGGANFDDYASFVAELAGAGADGIEVWNEMNLDREWPAGQINPTTYTDLLRRSYNAIKGRNGATLVISGAPSPTGAEGAFGLDHVWNDLRYINGMAAAGAASYADCIGTHYNEGILSPTLSTGDPREPYYTRYYSGMVDTYFNAFGGARKLCFTELGYLTDEGYPSLESTAPNFAWATNTTLAQQAQWLAEATRKGIADGKVRMLIVFNVDLTTYGADPQAGYAIVRPGGSCPACDSLHNVTGGR